MPRGRRAALLVAVLLCAPGAPSATPQGPAGALQAHYDLEGRLFRHTLERYREARAREARARERLERLAGELDEALAAADADLADLRRRSRELEALRAQAAALADEAAGLRLAVLAGMERLQELAAELQAAREGQLAPAAAALEGRWEVAFTPGGEVGEMELRVEGTLVRGTYRLDDGAQGAVEGTVAEGRLELRRIGARGGFESLLRGELDPEAGRIEGTWLATDVSGGAASSGAWTARKLPPPEG